jgi:hypothetical protein
MKKDFLEITTEDIKVEGVIVTLSALGNKAYAKRYVEAHKDYIKMAKAFIRVAESAPKEKDRVMADLLMTMGEAIYNIARKDEQNEHSGKA